jgi:hypothetical protein
MLEQVLDMNCFNMLSFLTLDDLIIKYFLVIALKLLLLREW